MFSLKYRLSVPRDPLNFTAIYCTSATFGHLVNYDREYMTLLGHLLGNIVKIDVLSIAAQRDFSPTIIITFRPMRPPQLYCYLLHFSHIWGYSREETPNLCR